MNSSFIKSKKFIVIALFLVVAVLSVILTGKVAINYNISDYLDESTETKISLEIIEKEFGAAGNVQVMIEDIDVETANSVKNTIRNIPNVLTVNFDQYDENYYKDGNALFVALVDGDEYSNVAREVLANIKAELDERFEGRTTYGGAIVEKANLRAAIQSEIAIILVISVILAAIIMLLTSKSWIEPVILLGSSGVAILINMGTNIIFGEISYITNAVSAILQLALSVDYSIVLLHSYRALKKTSDGNESAMKQAVKGVLSPVSASALTTIAGLLALLFMSFRIGFDIGIVLMKGIVISAVTSLTLLPVILLLLDKAMTKTAKKDLVISGKWFADVAIRFGKVIVPIALALIIVCGALQFGNTYSFTDTKNTDALITDTFGKNNAVVVVYPKGEGNFEDEKLLGDKLAAYKTADGKGVLKNYTAYSNTVRELYDVDTATRKLGLPRADVEMLLTMYHLYGDPSALKLSTRDFVECVGDLIENDPDIGAFAGEEMVKTIGMLLVIDEMMNGEYTAEEFHTLATTGAMEGVSLSLFAVKQMYGLYFYDSVADQTADLEGVLNCLLSLADKGQLGGMLDDGTISALRRLSSGIADFKLVYESSPVMQALPKYKNIYNMIKTRYTYEELMPAITKIVKELTGEYVSTAGISPLAVQQLYIMYFNEIGTMPNGKTLGRDFVDYVNATYPKNPVIADNLSEDARAKLTDLCIVDEFLLDTTAYTYEEMAAKIGELQSNITSMSSGKPISEATVSGVYVKHSIKNGAPLAKGVMAFELLDFVVANMNENELLKTKMNEETREKVEKAKNDIKNAESLFIGDTYSRMLLSIDLPSEGEESGRFVEYLVASVKEVFGNEAHVGGEIVSTYDLGVAFNADNTLISIFTIVSIFLIIMIVFRSLSLPVVLVAVIQGAIWICMSTSLISGPMFFMSYIMATCILMGATIDYGILMSTNYVRFRETLDKREALYSAVAAAMPTIFTSGLVLTICGFVVGIVASQNSISSVGVLLGKGTLVSVVVITLVLPALLYLLDGFILKLTKAKKK